MIKIYEKLWFIKGRDKGNLSYMCQFETIEGGEIAPNIKGMQSTGRRWANNHKTEQFSDWHDVEDGKYVNLFLSRYLTHKEPKLYAEVLAKPNIVEVIRNELMEVDLRDIGTLYAPERVKNKIVEMVPELYNGTQSEMISIRQKGE